MAQQLDFNIRVQDPVRQRLAQIRNAGAWEDIQLPLAEVVEMLTAQMSNVEGQTQLLAGSVTQFATELPQSARANIVDSISNRIRFVEGDVSVSLRRITSIEAELPDKASVSAVNSLSTDLSEAEGEIEANQTLIASLTTTVDGKAETSAVTALSDRVTATEDSITTNQSDITSLQTTIATKADTSALTALTNQVTANETSITTNQSNITALNTTVGTKADATALTTLSNRVAANETSISTIQTDVTSLTTTVGTKADTTALTALSNRVDTTESDITTVQSDITSLTTNVNTRATQTALDTLSQSVTANANTIASEQTKLTSLTTTVSGKADSSSLTALSGRVDVTESDITVINSEITALEARIVGTNLGPETNSFTGTTRALAEASRDRYFTNNPTKLAQYDADDSINIRLTWGVLRVYQFRRESAWVDNGEVEPTATAVTTLNATVTQHTTSIDANTTNITANSQAITALTSTVAGIDVAAISTLETKVTNIENVDGSTTLAGLARWLVKTQVNDLVGGVGLYNDGETVDFIIAASRFAVVPTGWEGADSEKRIPFAVITDHRYVMTWNAFAGATSYQYRTSTSADTWGAWQNAPASRRVQITTTEDRRWQIRAIPGNRLSNIETFIEGDTDSAAPVFPAPAITVTRASTAQTYIDNAAIRVASITGAKITNAAITNAHIANATILGAKIADAQIGTAHIIDASILSAKIGLAQINNAHITDATIQFAKIAKGDIFDLTIGDEIKSKNFQLSGTRTIPAVAAEAIVLGMTFTANSPGTGGNNQSVKFTASRISSVSGSGIVVSGDATDLVIELQDDTNSDTVFFDRDDVADAVNAYGSSGVTAAGTGDLTVDFTGLVASVTESQTIDLPSSSYAEGSSGAFRPGTRFKQWIPTNVSLDGGKFSTGNTTFTLLTIYDDDWIVIDFNGATLSQDFRSSGLLTLINDDNDVLSIEISDLNFNVGANQFTGRPSNQTDVEDFYDTLSVFNNSEEATLILELVDDANSTKDVATQDLSGGKASETITGGAGWRIKQDGSVAFNQGTFRGSVSIEGNARIGVDISSGNYAAGSAGWIIKQDGTAEFDAASIRGVLSADHISSDVRNWTYLGGSSSFSRDQRLTFLDFTGYDSLWFLLWRILGSGRGTHHVSAIKTSSVLTGNAYGIVDDNNVEIQRVSGSNTQLRLHATSGRSRWTIRELWGVNNPAS